MEKCLLKLGFGVPVKCRLGSDLDFLMKFERLDDDFKLACEKLDIPYSPLPKSNPSIHAHYSKYYDDELKEIVARKYAEEIKLGNYTFEKS